MSSALTPLIIIPARLSATRLPRKPLADIHGKPMIVHVWERSLKANLGPVLVACGDQEIYDVIKAAGGEAILTDPALPSGSDRVKAAATLFDPEERYPLVLNVQGDFPTLSPALLESCLEPFSHTPDLDIATLATEIHGEKELIDPNVVKIAVAMDIEGHIGRALYFSRNPLPSGPGPHYHHIGLYAYKRAALNRFVDLPVHPLEARERLEQLRALADGMSIHVKIVSYDDTFFGVDTQEDLDRAMDILGKSYT